MNGKFFAVAIFLTCFSGCDDSDAGIKTDSLAAFWNLEKVTINGSNSTEYNYSPANFLELGSDKTFSRAYESGEWNLSGRNLTLDRDESFGMSDWSYQIISVSDDALVMEMQLIESQYRWDFESFTENEVLTIREVYNKIK